MIYLVSDKELEKLVLKTISNIRLIDVVNDVINTYKYEGDTLVNVGTESLTEHLQDVQGKIESSYLKDYMKTLKMISKDSWMITHLSYKDIVEHGEEEQKVVLYSIHLEN